MEVSSFSLLFFSLVRAMEKELDPLRYPKGFESSSIEDEEELDFF